MYVDDLVFAFRREVFYLVREVFCLNFELVTKGGILMQ